MHRGAEAFGEIGLAVPAGTGPDIYLMAVPESEVVKNRVHLDLQAEPTMGAKVARLEAAGASVLASGRILTDLKTPTSGPGWRTRRGTSSVGRSC